MVHDLEAGPLGNDLAVSGRAVPAAATAAVLCLAS
jgi:hypothetical protein